MNCSLMWRAKSQQRAEGGCIYTTAEGLQLGIRGDVSIEKYVDWDFLCMEQKEYIYSFIHSGLLSLGEPNL